MSTVYKSLVPLFALMLWGAPVGAQVRPDFEMDSDPRLEIPADVKVFSKRLKVLWIEALRRPEADFQRMAAEAIGRGHLEGVPEMHEAVAPLVDVVRAPSSHPAARLGAARTLVILGAKAASPELAASAARFGADLRQFVEPALAEWDYEPLRAVWLARLTAPGTRHRDLLLAIRCLAAARASSAVAPLLELVHDRLRRPDVRTEAARAAGLLADQGLEPDVRRLVDGAHSVDGKGSLDGIGAAPVLDRVCAVLLIARHKGPEAEALLGALAVDAEPAVAFVALTRLIEIDPHLVLPLAERAMQSGDHKVRQRGADAYVLLPDAQRVAVVARLLDDPHPAVRRSVCASLFTLAAQPELAAAIRQAATEMLAGDRWRGLEQAALLLGALDHKPSGRRMVELLDFNRGEVGIAAAWGLKRLAIPETLPAMLDKAARITAIFEKREVPPHGVEEQIAHLFEAFGRMKYADAGPLMIRFIPKGFPGGERPRCAAIWSLGLLHENVPDEPLAVLLIDRVTDDSPVPPEFSMVKAMAAISIARMRAVSQVPALRKYLGPKILPVSYFVAIGWALKELTGEELPGPEPRLTGKGGWFLEPIDD